MADSEKKNHTVTTRTAFSIGTSLCITIPADFVKRLGLKQGDILTVFGKNRLTVVPPDREEG